MPKNIKTHLYCYDDHRGFSEEVRKRFDDTARYTVVSFQTREDIINHLSGEKDKRFCKVAILGVHDTKEHVEMIDHLTSEIQKIDPQTGLILLCPQDRIDEIRKSVKFNIDAYVPKNANSVLRIHNTVKKLVSEHSMNFFRRRRNVSLYILIAFLILCGLLILAARIILPEYF
jgi:DNA-binding NarL/FixJ family response regulator